MSVSPDFYTPDYTLTPCDTCVERAADNGVAPDAGIDDVEEFCADLRCECECHIHDPAEIDFDDNGD